MNDSAAALFAIAFVLIVELLRYLIPRVLVAAAAAWLLLPPFWFFLAAIIIIDLVWAVLMWLLGLSCVGLFAASVRIAAVFR